MTDPIFRPLAPADLAETVAMQCRAVDVLGRTHYRPAEIAVLIAATREPDYAEALLGNDVWVAVDADGAVLGSAGWGLIPVGPGLAATTGRIRKVFVEPGLAGRGLGRRLVGAAELRARANGVLDFIVRANLNAVPFYERLGYRSTGPGELAVGGVTVPMTMMEKPRETVV